MQFHETDISGAFLIELERLEDERGFFARTYCRREFETHGLNPETAQCNISFNRHCGTLRGLHSQRPPHQETKLVRCTRGRIYDVIVDLRSESPTFRKHFGAELSALNRLALYVPEGVYHGFLTLEDSCEVFYQMSQFYVDGQLLGVRWDDPALGIRWPSDIRIISERDRSFPDLKI